MDMIMSYRNPSGDQVNPIDSDFHNKAAGSYRNYSN